MSIGPLIRAASISPTVAEVEPSRDEAMRRKKLVVFVSGGGSNFKKIHEGCISGSFKGDVALLVTNRKGPTIYFVAEEYDTWQTLSQSAVRVIANDTPEEFAKRVLHEVIQEMCILIEVDRRRTMPPPRREVPWAIPAAVKPVHMARGYPFHSYPLQSYRQPGIW